MTRNGDGTITLSYRWLTAGVALLTMMTLLGSTGMRVFLTADRLQHAVQDTTLNRIVDAQRARDGDQDRSIADLQTKVLSAAQQNIALTCFVNQYPAVLCDTVPRLPRKPR